MTESCYDNIRHERSIIFRAFFYFLLLSAVTAADSASIQISPDYTGQSAFIYHRFNPFIQTDLQRGPITIDGGLGLPLSAWQFSAAPELTVNDSVPIVTYFNYHQGDYSYRDIAVGLMHTQDSGRQISFTGAGRSFSGKYGDQGPTDSNLANVLQNYQLDYHKADSTGSTALGVAFHTENSGLPRADFSQSNRRSDSFHAGVQLMRKWKQIWFESSNSLQAGLYALDINQVETYALWNLLAIQTEPGPGFGLNLTADSKWVMAADDSLKHDRSMTACHILGSVDRERWHIRGGLNVLNSQIEPAADIAYQVGDFTVGAEYTTDYQLPIDTNFQFAAEVFTYTRCYLSWTKSSGNLLIGAHRSETSRETVPGFYSEGSLRWKGLRMEFSGQFYSSDSVLFDQYAKAGAAFKKTIPGKRYSPFLKITGSHIHFTGNRAVNLLEFAASVQEFTTDYTTQSIDLELGFEVHNFRFTYRFQNIRNESLSFSPFIQPLGGFNYFEVLWIFDN